VINAVSAQNLIVPSGTMKVGQYEYAVETNSAPSVVNDLNNLPVKRINGAVIYVRDVAHVRDGFPPQTNIVRVDGQRSTLMTILKSGSASTLEIIAGIYEKLPPILRTLDPEPKVTPLNDQSIFVRGAINGVVREAIIAACLTGMMILVFLGSWRSTIIIAVSIPLSILSSLIMLAALGETVNIMTLGGLALAVGILVDDATVEIENINRNLESGKEIEQAILDGAAQIAIPAFVSTLAICIVFVPMFFLSGVSRYLFVPLAEAVVFAMMASYLLSRTVVPTMAKYLLKEHTDEAAEKRRTSRNPFVSFQRGFEHYFEKLRLGYVRLLTFSVDHAVAFIVVFLLICVVSVAGLAPQLGQDFFPSVDSGGFKIHMRAHTGTRIEETASLCDHIDNTIRREIPKAELTSIIDNIGLPYSGYNLSYSTSAPVGTADADISVQLNEKHHPSAMYVNRLREVLTREYPGVTFYVLPTDIVTQILNFGLSAPIDIQIIGPRLNENRAYAEKLLNDVKYVAGTADTRIQQPFDLPKWTVDVDRTRSSEVGLAQRDVATSLLVSLSGSFQTTPSFYLDPRNGVSYNVAVQAPQYDIQSLSDLRSLPVTATTGSPLMPLSNTATTGAPGAPQSTQVLGNLATLVPGAELGTVSHYDIQPVLDIYSNVDGADLGSVTRKIEAVIRNHEKDVPHGTQIVLRGQSETMRKSYIGLLAGLLFSILLVYFLIVVNFQSWLDPFLIISALPAAITGIVWFLFLTGTRLSVPALTGTIMCMGVATANSILVVSFAREQLETLVGDARKAALNAGFVRFRPVLMTALAMIIGMVPMALGLGDGGEQNAPLGRAVIGGLLLATVATLFFVPTFFSALHGRLEKKARRKRAPQDNVLDEQFPEQI
jgi:multidrug efflux pump subunit AcrB